MAESEKSKTSACYQTSANLLQSESKTVNKTTFGVDALCWKMPHQYIFFIPDREASFSSPSLHLRYLRTKICCNCLALLRGVVCHDDIRGSHLFFRRQTGDGHVGAADCLDLLDVLETVLAQQLWQSLERETVNIGTSLFLWWCYLLIFLTVDLLAAITELVEIFFGWSSQTHLFPPW